MAVWALLSISQTVKAADVTVYFQSPDGWSTPVQAYVYDDAGKYHKEWKDAEACTPYYTSTGIKLWSYTFPDQFTNVIFKDGNNHQYPIKDIKMKVVNNYVYVYDTTNPTNPTGTPLSEFVKNSAFTYTLTGGYEGGGWSDESANFEFVGDGKYTYTFTAAQTGEFRFRVKTSYKTKEELCPDVDPTTKRKELTSTPEDVKYANPNDNSAASIKDNYWFYSVTAGNKYTFTLSEQYLQATDGGYYHSRKLSVVPEEAVVTKVIKLFNGSSELTGSNGKYTLDLSSATTDATITLSIDDETYGLAPAQTISTVGTTSDIAFTAEGTEKLTLKAGLIYSLTVTEDGKMTVVAEEKVNPYAAVYEAGFYLVGDFMSQYNDKTVNPGGDTPGKINYERLYFKFEQQNDGSYKIDIPACLTAKMQILGISVDGVSRVYGPSTKVELYGSKVTGTANPETNGSLGGKDDDLLKVVNDVTVDNNYWNLKTRNDEGIDDDGLYEISFKYDSENKTPTVWTIKHDALKRVAYLLSDAEGATAQPVYVTRKKIGSELRDDNLYSNECKVALHFNGQNGYYVLSYIVSDMNNEQKTQALKAKDGIHATKSVNDNSGTHDKLFFLGNGGYDWSTSNNHNKVRANLKPFKMNLKGTKVITYNPNQGVYELAKEDGSYGMTGEIKIDNSGVVDYPDAISMVGPAIPSTTTTTGEWLWKATAGDMTYDESDRCYKLVLNTSAESFKKTFRFVGDHDIAMNWYEDDTKANDDYPTSKEGFSDATVADPNFVNYVSDCTAENIKHDQDIIWNRGAGLWTVRFYIDVDNAGKRTFRYTITGASKIYIPVTAHMGKLLRTYTSAVDVVPVNDDVQIFAAYSYEKGSKNETGYGDETGTVKLYRMKFIPANQGVVLFAPNSPVADGTKTKMEVVPAYSATVKRYSRDAYDYIEKWAESETKEDIWVFDHNYSEGQNKWNNYMIPVLADTKVTQFYYDKNNEWSGRVFSFTRLSQTDAGRDKIVADSEDDYYGFFRAAGNVKASYSYLMLPKTVMTSNGQILVQTQDGPNKKEDIKNFSKSMVWFEGIDAPMDNETTGISELKDNSSNIDAAYYTLQGVKVVKPVKGIYIHQGKKVIVK